MRSLLPALGWFWVSLASAIVTMPVTHPTAADPPVQRSWGLACRKQVDEGATVHAADDGAVETIGTLFNTHSGDAIPLSSTEPTLPRLSDMLADRVTASRIMIDGRLLELLRQIGRRHPGARIELVSGYRSAKLNEMLRKKGHNVASRSRHSLGHAVDFRVVGMTPAALTREILELGWTGGIGEYDRSTDTFVHADVGPKRRWREAG